MPAPLILSGNSGEILPECAYHRASPDIAREGSCRRIDRSSDGFYVLHKTLDRFLPHSGASRAFQVQLPLPPWFIHVPGQNGL